MEKDANDTSSAEAAGTEQGFTPEVRAAIKQLNVDPSNSRFMKLVDDLLRPESLPRGWSAVFHAQEGVWRYTDKAGVAHDKHPVHDYYIGAMFMDRGGYAQLKALAAEKPPTTAEVQQMGQYLNIKQDEDVYIWQVAEMALCAPLPPSWEESVQEGQGGPMVMFRDVETGATQQEHPLDGYFLELIRRRRRELLRKKKAALKSLQALVKMGGMARRSQLAALRAAAGATDSGSTANAAPTADDDADGDEGEEVEDMDPKAQSALLSAWQGLLGTAVHLVKSLQTAQWDGGSSSGSSSSSSGFAGGSAWRSLCGSNAAEAADIELGTAAGPQGGSSGSGSSGGRSSSAALTPGATSAAAAITGSAAAATAAVQDRLKHLGLTLSSALDPSTSSPVTAATAALEEIEALAIQAAAAGSDADALVQVLAGQGVYMREYGADASSNSSWGAQYHSSDVGTARLSGTGSAAGSRSTTGTISGTGEISSAAVAAGDGTDAGGSGTNQEGSDSTSKRRRPSLDHSQQLASPGGQGSRSHRKSLLHNKQVSFVAANVGPSSDGGTHEGWSLSGNAANPAGLAAAANVRALAALRRESELKEDAAAAAGAGGDVAAAADSSTGGDAAATTGGSGQHLKSTGQPAGHVAITVLGGFDVQGATLHSSTGNGSNGVQNKASQDQQGMQHSHFFLSTSHPPAATAALQHMLALQSVLQEAVGLIRSWQQQRAIIALLQQRLKAAAVQAAQGQQRLNEALQQLEQIKEQQALHSGTAASASAEYQQLLQQFEAAQKELERVQGEKQQLLDSNQQLQQSLEAALAAAAAAQEKQQQLEQQLQLVMQQVQKEQAEQQAQQLQLDQTRQELEASKAEHARLQADTGCEAASTAADLSQLLTSHSELERQHQKLQESLTAAQAAAVAANDQQLLLQQQLQQTQKELQELQAAHTLLQRQHQQQGEQLVQSQQALSMLQADYQQQQAQLAIMQQQLQLLQADEQHQGQQLAGTLQQLQQLQAEHQQLHSEHQQQGGQLANTHNQLQQLQAQYKYQEEQLSDTRQQLQQVQAEHQQQQQQLASTQQQLQQAQAEKQQLQQQQQELQTEKEQLLEQQLHLLDKQGQMKGTLKSVQKELTHMHAAAKAAAEKRAAMPHSATQVSAVDAAEQHWVRTRGVQTGEELDPRSRKDVGTPADLSLLSFFFREIKAKQRGGGGALLGYDPQAALAAAATAVPPGSAKSWSGGPMLPPISHSANGGAEPAQAALKKRPATMPGGLRARPRESSITATAKKPAEPESEGGGFDTRPAPFEVKARVDRRRDKAMRLEQEALEGGDNDRWDYSHDERDNEIAELKRRLVEEQHKAREAAGRAGDELKAAMTELQASKRSLELLQSDNFMLRKEVDSLKISMQAAGLSGPLSGPLSGSGSAAGDGSPFRASVFGSLPGKAGRASIMSSGAGMGSSGSGTGASYWGSGSGAGTRGSVAMLSLSGGSTLGFGAGIGAAAAGGLQGSAGGVRASTMVTGRLSTMPGQQLVPTLQTLYAPAAKGVLAAAAGGAKHSGAVVVSDPSRSAGV